MRTLYFCPWFLLSSILFFLSSPILSRRRLDVYHFHTWCGLSANLGCRSETCCTQLAGNAGCKNSPSVRHHTNLSGSVFVTKVHIYNWKKLVKQQYLPKCPHNMVNFGPLPTEICWRVWGTTANFSRFRILAALLCDTLVVGISETAALIRGHHLYSAGGHHVRHWPTF